MEAILEIVLMSVALIAMLGTAVACLVLEQTGISDDLVDEIVGRPRQVDSD